MGAFRRSSIGALSTKSGKSLEGKQLASVAEGGLSTATEESPKHFADDASSKHALVRSASTKSLSADKFSSAGSVSSGDRGKERGAVYELKEEIREDARGNVFVKGLARIPVASSAEVLSIIDKGLRLRATEATSMNDTSSRSHTVFTIEVSVRDDLRGVSSEGGAESFTTGKLHLVDLAGSERLKKSESRGTRMQEALHINKSLTALGKVIVALDPIERKKNAHVPYRDSKLTRLLQNSIGGDSFTTLLATIRPVASHAEECLSTLQFANRCRRVANNPRVHRVTGAGPLHETRSQEELVRRLRDEITRLKEERHAMRSKICDLTGTTAAELEELLKEGGGDTTLQLSSDEHGGAAAQGVVFGACGDPAAVQACVVTAVLAALKSAGVGCSVDPKTGGVKLSDGAVLAGTLAAAFATAGQFSSERRQQLAKQHSAHLARQRGGTSRPVAALAARVAQLFGWPSHLARSPGAPVFYFIFLGREEWVVRMCVFNCRRRHSSSLCSTSANATTPRPAASKTNSSRANFVKRLLFLFFFFNSVYTTQSVVSKRSRASRHFFFKNALCVLFRPFFPSISRERSPRSAGRSWRRLRRLCACCAARGCRLRCGRSTRARTRVSRWSGRLRTSRRASGR